MPGVGNLMRSLLAQIGSMPMQGGAEERYAGSDVGAAVAPQPWLSLQSAVWSGTGRKFAPGAVPSSARI